MPHDDSLTLSLTIVCEPCGRRGRYNVSRLLEQHGREAKLTDLVRVLVGDCPKMHSVSVHERCRAVYEGLIV
jgi:hypothetical protein